MSFFYLEKLKKDLLKINFISKYMFKRNKFSNDTFFCNSN